VAIDEGVNVESVMAEEKKVGGYKDLTVWQKAITLCPQIMTPDLFALLGEVRKMLNALRRTLEARR
jgi:hypothetical protein